MKKYIRSLVHSVIFVSLAFAVNAQKRSDMPTQNQWITAKIDAKHTEWGDSLRNFDKDTKFHYSIGNDDKNLYLAIAVTDKQRIQNIISGGITFFINTEGKKKDGQLVIFPVVAPIKPSKKSSPEQMMRESLKSARAIRVSGFKKIPDGNLSVNNDFGIRGSAALTDSGEFIYETAIPLERLNLTPGSAKEFDVNIKLNIPDHGPRVSRVYESPYETQRRRYRGDYGAPEARTVVTTSAPAGFWIKKVLAVTSLAK